MTKFDFSVFMLLFFVSKLKQCILRLQLEKSKRATSSVGKNDVIASRNDTCNLFTWLKQKWLFMRAGFFPANQGFLNTFQVFLVA